MAERVGIFKYDFSADEEEKKRLFDKRTFIVRLSGS